MTGRLDRELARRGLARSRTQAQTLIASGAVRVDDVLAQKSSQPVDEADTITVAPTDGHVSRAAGKLVAALAAFDVTVRDRTALDMGASTGGFTQVLRERGADPVIAVDVGHGQLDPRVAADPGVRAVEGFNVRYMTRASLAEASGITDPPTLVCGDLSFISLRTILPAAAATASADADFVLLIKPQFEVGRAQIRAGVVTDPSLHAEAIRAVLTVAEQEGLHGHGLVGSPVVGTHGNREYLVHLARRAPAAARDWSQVVGTVTGAI